MVLDRLRDRLIKETAAEEGDIITVVNAAVAYLRAQSIELPAFTVISNVCAKALRIADENLMDKLGSCLAQRTRERLDALLVSKGTRSAFDKFKEDIGSAGPKEILKALGQLEQIGQYPLDAPVLRRLTRRKIDSFALLGWKNNAAELRHLKPERRRIILLCFLRKRRAELLDLTDELVIRYWNSIQAQSNR